MKNFFLSLSIIVAMASTLISCTMLEPRVFDVPQSQWNVLTSEQKQEIIRGYNERKNTETQMIPIKHAVDVAGGLLHK